VLWRYFRLTESKVRALCMVLAGRKVGAGAGAREISPAGHDFVLVRLTYMGLVTAVCHT
jgi:hypothetical protein